MVFRRAVDEGTVLWGKEADGLVKGSWLYSEPEAGQGAGAADGASGYFFANNADRLRQGLGYGTPCEVCFGHTASKKSVELGN
jgi:hypothetical protein